MNRPEQSIPLFKVYMNPSAKDAACEVLDSGYLQFMAMVMVVSLMNHNNRHQ